MSSFGDFDPDDALDHEPADPEQVARKLIQLQIRHGVETVPWDEMSAERRALRVYVVASLLEWMRRQGAF